MWSQWERKGSTGSHLLIDHVSVLLQELTEVTLDAQQTQAWDQLRCMYRGPSRVRHITPTNVPAPTLSVPSLDIIPSSSPAQWYLFLYTMCAVCMGLIWCLSFCCLFLSVSMHRMRRQTSASLSLSLFLSPTLYLSLSLPYSLSLSRSLSALRVYCITH